MVQSLLRAKPTEQGQAPDDAKLFLVMVLELIFLHRQDAILAKGELWQILALRISTFVCLVSVLSEASSIWDDELGSWHLSCSFLLSFQSTQTIITTVQGDTAMHILWVTVRKLQNASDKLKVFSVVIYDT